MPQSLDRRPLLLLLAGGVGLTTVGVGARVFLNPGDGDGGPDAPGSEDGGAEGPALTLSAESGSDIDSLTVALGDDLLPRTGDGAWESARLPTSTHSMVALTWSQERAQPHVRIRSRMAGRWGSWQRVPLLHDRPDPGSGEGNDTTGTALVWIGRSDGIQVRVGGKRPDDLALLLLHPNPHARDRSVGRASTRGAAPLAMRRAGAVVTRPDILSRKDWGADESWRSGKPSMNDTISQVHVHHTVSRNDYLPEDVPALIRGMYRYHTKTLGWSDIAYNFLVDRFGRVWTGRSGGAARPVRGAHTLGFNKNSCGISAIGNFDLVAPSVELLSGIAATAAWKLDLYGGDPLGSVAVTSEGSDKQRRGATVTLPVIDGHRDTNDTSCPGGQLYASLQDIRNRAKGVVAAAAGPVAVTAPASVSGATGQGSKLTAAPGSFDPADAAVTYAWLRDGAPVASGPTYVVTSADVGRQLAVRVDAAKAGRATASQTVAVTTPVTGPGRVSVTVTPRRRRAVVKVSVAPPPGSAVAVAEGQVVVSTGSREKTITLSGGRGKAKFKRLQPGERRFRATYGGSGLVTGSRRGAKAVVPS